MLKKGKFLSKKIRRKSCSTPTQFWLTQIWLYSCW